MAFIQATPVLRTAGSAGGSALATLTGVAAGHTLYVVPCNYPSGFSGVSSSPARTWTRSVVVGDGGINFAEIWSAPIPAGGGGDHTITVTPSSGGGNYVTAVAAEFSGHDNSNLIDRNGTVNNSFTVSTSLATQAANEFVLAVAVADDGASPIGWGTPSGFTLLAKEEDSNSYTGMIVAYKTVSATGVQSAVFSATGLTGSQVDAAIATFRLSGGVGSAVDLTGAAVAGAGASGSLTKVAGLSGSALAGAQASGSVTHLVPLAGGAVSSSVASGSLSLHVQLGGDAFAAALAAAQMDHGVPLSGAGTGGAGAAAVLSLAVTLSGDAVAQMAAAGDMAHGVPLTGDAAAGAVAAGSLLGTTLLTGSADAGASAAGSLSLLVHLSAQAVADSLATGALSVRINLDGEAVTAALAGGELTTTSVIELQGAATAGASAAGSLTVGAPSFDTIARIDFRPLRSRSAAARASHRGAAFKQSLRTAKVRKT